MKKERQEHSRSEQSNNKRRIPYGVIYKETSTFNRIRDKKLFQSIKFDECKKKTDERKKSRNIQQLISTYTDTDQSKSDMNTKRGKKANNKNDHGTQSHIVSFKIMTYGTT